MEIMLDCFFEDFSKLDRITLHASYKRRNLVEYFNTLIEGCSRGQNCDSQETCRDAIISIVRFHQNSLRENGSVCLMGKYHDILYVALKLCYDWQLKDTGTVVALLDDIYLCENTFERLWVGALFGTKAPYFIAGWKSDFNDREENVRAVVYYLDHANSAGLEYPFGSKDTLTRFIDIPIESCGKTPPLKIVVQLGLADQLHILLRFGAAVVTRDEPSLNIIELLLKHLNEFDRKYPYNLVACLQMLLRAVSGVYVEPDPNHSENSNKQRDAVLLKYSKLVEDGIIPSRRCGISPPELKHLCRCTIRIRLWQNYQLPSGIRQLPIPESLHKYIDLLTD